MKLVDVGLVGESEVPASFNASVKLTCPLSAKTVGTSTWAPLPSVCFTIVRTSDDRTFDSSLGVAPDAPCSDAMIRYELDVPFRLPAPHAASTTTARNAAPARARRDRRVCERESEVMTVLIE